MKTQIAPSLLSADFSRLAEEIKDVEALGVDFLHLDIMDGHFVPNITIGPPVIKSLRPVTSLRFEAHLMIESPQNYIDSFVDAGADIITLHIETIKSSEFKKQALKLHKIGKKIAISLNPKTMLSQIGDCLDHCDMVLIMTVQPGFGGQKFMPEVLPKISKLRSYYKGDIAVDGGIDYENGKLTVKEGANILACGTYIFKAKDRREAIEKLKNITI